MVIQRSSRSRHTHASFLIEAMVAMALIAATVFPLASSIRSERILARAHFHRAVAMEIVDGEIEILAAGEWRTLENGTHPYTVNARSASTLPPGKFVVSLQDQRVRLEWIPDAKHKGGTVVREISIR